MESCKLVIIFIMMKALPQVYINSCFSERNKVLSTIYDNIFFTFQATKFKIIVRFFILIKIINVPLKKHFCNSGNMLTRKYFFSNLGFSTKIANIRYIKNIISSCIFVCFCTIFINMFHYVLFFFSTPCILPPVIKFPLLTKPMF